MKGKRKEKLDLEERMRWEEKEERINKETERKSLKR